MKLEKMLVDLVMDLMDPSPKKVEMMTLGKRGSKVITQDEDKRPECNTQDEDKRPECKK